MESLLLNTELEKEGVAAVGEDHLAIMSEPGKVLVYSTVTGLRQGEIASQSTATISALAMEADSLYVVCGDRVEVWDLSCWLCLAVIQAEDSTPEAFK